jgi:threonine aldolase
MVVACLLVMAEGLAEEAAPYLRKQQMQLSSKMRFLSAQILGLLEDDIWRHNAGHANAMAARLAAGLSDVPGVRLAYPMESNGVFAEIGTDLAEALAADWEFHVWSGGPDGRCVVRLMTAYDTSEADVDALLADIAARS